MNRSQAFSGRTLYGCIKRGYTCSELMEKFDISEEALRQHIESIFGRGSVNVWRDIRANERKHGNTPHAKKKIQNFTQALIKADLPEGVALTPEAIELFLGNKAKEEKPITEVLENSTASSEDAPITVNIPTLEAEITQLTGENTRLEERHRRNLRKYQEYISELRQIEEEASNFYKRFMQSCEDYTVTAMRMAELEGQLNSTEALREENLERITSLKQEILNQAETTLLIFANGNIEVADDPTGTINDYLIYNEATFQELLDNPACENLRVREIKTLTQLVSMYHGFTGKLQLVFDSEQLEIAYNTITNSDMNG